MKQSHKALLGLALGIILYKVIDGGCRQKAADGADGIDPQTHEQTYEQAHQQAKQQATPARADVERPAPAAHETHEQGAPGAREGDYMESSVSKPYVNPELGITFPIQAHLHPVWFEKEDGGFLFFVDEADRDAARDVPAANRVARIRGEVFPTPSSHEKIAWEENPRLVRYKLEQRVQQEGGAGEWQLLVPAGSRTLQLVAGADEREVLAAIAQGLEETE